MEQLPERDSALILQIVHALRAPLASIQGTLDVLLQGYGLGNAAVQEELLRLTRDRAAAMLDMVNDLLSLGDIRQTEACRELSAISLADVFWQVLPVMRIKATLRGVHLDVDVQDTLPPVRAIAEHMTRLLSNLTDNAIKYTDSGGRVAICVREEEHCIVGTVEDTGIGIPSEDLSRVFDGFYCAKNAREIEPYGTGLGLPTVKRVVELYGGRICVDSSLGRGSKFCFSLPRFEKGVDTEPVESSPHPEE